eukprot:1158312-Pelagomonas_calceolata.AAC.5
MSYAADGKRSECCFERAKKWAVKLETPLSSGGTSVRACFWQPVHSPRARKSERGSQSQTNLLKPRIA